MNLLQAAIANWLRANVTLVSLTGHSASDLRLVAATPEMSTKADSVVFIVGPLFTREARRISSGVVTFTIVGSTRISCMNIGRQLISMLAPTSPTQVERSRGPDISDDDIRCMSLEIRSFDGTPRRNEDQDVWLMDVNAGIFWHRK